MVLSGLCFSQVLKADEISEKAFNTQHEIIVQEKIQELSLALTSRAVAQRGKYYGACVIGVRQFLGVGRDQIQGMAKNTTINSQHPEVGAIIVLNMSRYGHVGVVLKITETEVIYYDTNYHWNGRAGIEKINIQDKRIKGYKIL